MTALISFEWLKLEKWWMPRAVVALISALTLGASCVLGANVVERGDLLLPRGWLAALSFSSIFAPFFWPLLGASWAGNEYGWGTIRSVLSRSPNRLEQALSAQAVLLAAVALGILAVLVAGSIAGVLVAVFSGSALLTAGVWSATFLSTLLAGFVTAWFVSAFYLVVSYAAATLARSAAVGVGVGLGATLAQYILRSILFGLGGHWRDIAGYFPIVYANSVITRVVGPQLIPGTALATARAYEPSVGQSIEALAIYGAICIAITLVAVRVRDVTA
ncbi:MAG TPA: hypothetical protein VHK65_08675 [Candidatus Dormibacteraeota bacterium]|nr:hypothetical protein [Candidatus Dormibacteraeota bacterium]